MPADSGTPDLIDLGEDFAPVPDPEPARRAARRWSRAARVAVPIVLSLFLVSAAASVAPAPIRPSAHIPLRFGSAVGVFGGRAVVLDTVYRNTISGYDLDGGPHWTSPMALGGSDYTAHLIGDALVVNASHESPGPIRTEAFDIRSGRKLWDRPDPVADVDPAGDVILQTAPGRAGETAVYRVDARTGAEHWRATVPAECGLQFADEAASGPPYRFTTLCSPLLAARPIPLAPTLSLVDLGSGAQVATRTIRFAADPAVDSSPSSVLVLPISALTVLNGLVVVQAQTSGPTTTMSAYRQSDLAPLWSGLAIMAPDPIQSCGVVLCLSTPSGIRAIDPTTGAQIPGGVPPESRETPVPRFVAVAVNGSPGNTSLIDTVPRGLLVAAPTYIRGRTWLGVQHPTGIGIADAWKTTLIEPLPGAGPGSCLGLGVYLLCATASDAGTIWRLP